jgi:hypothetical protein
MFPALVGNAYWAESWRKCGAAALSPSRPGEGPAYLRFHCLEKMAEAELWESKHNMKRRYLRNHQYDILSRSTEGDVSIRGVQGCGKLVSSASVLFWTRDDFAIKSRDEEWWLHLLRESVEEGDRLGSNAGTALAEELDTSLKCVMPSPPQVEQFVAVDEEALRTFLTQHSGRPLFTAGMTCVHQTSLCDERQKRTNLEVGKSFGLVVSEGEALVFDSHRHYDPDGEERGMVLLHQKPRDLSAIAAWIYRYLLPCMRCDTTKQVDIVMVTGQQLSAGAESAEVLSMQDSPRKQCAPPEDLAEIPSAGNDGGADASAPERTIGMAQPGGKSDLECAPPEDFAELPPDGNDEGAVAPSAQSADVVDDQGNCF